MNGKQRLLRYVLILVVAGVAYWQREHLPQVPTEPSKAPAREKGAAVLKEDPLSGIAGTEAKKPVAKPVVKPAAKPVAPPSAKSAPPAKEAAPAKVRGYDVFRDARLVDRDGNDGDSFMVRAGGRDFELRLYFVDAPESYLSDRYENQQRRVADQARDLGGISSEEAVAVGKAAKKFTKEQLSGKTFTVYTYWEEVYEGDRFYGFVEFADGSDLGTRLVEEGLARIHTKGPGTKEKPVPTPDGSTFFQTRDKLESLERQSQRAKRGVWGL
jgi:endonuclease YncB( thermonuclease family)